jgi:hypothetical protein
MGHTKRCMPGGSGYGSELLLDDRNGVAVLDALMILEEKG